MKTFAIHTLGCKVNSYESEAIAKMMIADNYHQVDFKTTADVYIINTCTVTNKGDSKSRQKIRQAIKNNQNAVVCVVGCYAQVSTEEVQAIEGVDIVMGTQHRERLLEYINEFLETKQQKVDVQNIMLQKKFEGLEVTSFKENTRAFLKIQEGCSNYCTFCIIPFARGKIRSRAFADVLKEANELVQNGYKEIVLTGIHTAGYGEDLENISFDDLVEALITKVDGLKRLRISSIEASQISNRLIEMIKTNNIIVKHLHIPLQAGSDDILELMRRKYTINEFKSKIHFIQQEVPNISITTDVIVGFPNETDELFLQTYQNIKAIGFTGLHVFPYSKRKNTPAARMEGHLDESIKQKRVHQLVMLSKLLEDEYAQRFINQKVDVIIEEKNQENSIGHSSQFLKVVVPESIEKGTLCDVVIDNVKQGVCFGHVIEKDSH